ncbi:MAG: hypothetical protein K6G83_10530, partial [Lachnospiraceae bacterium]|nr:hypothetical protein [Lachnospiraceae bacterium]
MDDSDQLYDVAPSVTEAGVLSYTVKSGAVNSTGTITVVAETQNYNDVTFTVNLQLVDLIPVKPKTAVTLRSSTLTYGQPLSTLTFNNTVFVTDDADETVVAADLGVAKTKKAQTPVPSIRFAASGTKLDASLFAVSYAPAEVKEEGTYTATITPKDTRNFTGSMTATITVTADKKVMLSKAKVTISPKTFTYTGKEIVPAPTGIKVKLNGKTLAYGKDYEISELLHNVNPGTATVVLTAVEENEAGYVGSITGSFQIKKGRALSLGNGFSYVYNKSMPYVASGAKPVVTVKDGDTVLEKGKDYTISYSNNKAAGTGRITVKGTGKYSSSVKLD